MTTAAFIALLRQHPALPLVFGAGAETLPPGYHLTEVKRVAYETMDCGAATHRWRETQFELWVPAGAAEDPARPPMGAGKFLRIVDRVAAELPLAGKAEARVLADLGGGAAVLHDVVAVTAADGCLRVELRPERTRCKAAERRAAAATAAEPKAGCGCGSPGTAAGAAVCCA